MNKLTITISGKTKSGKTHMTAHLYRLLRENGFDVSFDDNDLNDADINLFGTKEIIHNLKQNLKIEINTVQVNR